MISVDLRTDPMKDTVELVFSEGDEVLNRITFVPGVGAPLLQREFERAMHIIAAGDPYRQVANILWDIIVRSIRGKS